MLKALIMSAMALCATSAVAQDSTAPTISPEADATVAAKAHADAVIVRSNAGDFFVNVTDSRLPQVRHVPSGLLCSFSTDDQQDTITFYPQEEGGPAHGDDVSCGSWWGAIFVTVFATRYPQGYSADALFASAVRDIQGAWQNVTPLENYDVARLNGQEEPLIAAFRAERGGGPRRTVVVLRNIGDWSFKARATGPADDAEVTKEGTFAFAVSVPGGWEIVQKK